MKDTALAAAKEMIKTMEGLADGLQERLRRTEAENEALRPRPDGRPCNRGGAGTGFFDLFDGQDGRRGLRGEHTWS